MKRNRNAGIQAPLPGAKGAIIEAPKAPRGVGSGKGVSPSPVGKASGEEGCAPSPEFFLIFCLAMVHFGAFWTLVLMLV